METLYRSPFYDDLVAAAAAICASDVEAEDIVQEAFIEDWAWRPSTEGKGREGGSSESPSRDQVLEAARGRLRTKVRWRARTVRNKRDRRAAKEDRILYESRLGRSGAGGPAEEYRRRRCAALVGQAVEALPEGERAAWLLVRKRRRSYARAAQALGCSTKAVEQRLYRARKRIRAALEERGFRCLDDIR